MICPFAVVVAGPVLVIERSETAPTRMLAVDVLFEVFGSNLDGTETVAVLVIVPTELPFMTIVMRKPVPGNPPGELHVRLSVPVHEPELVVADTNVPPERATFTVSDDADGPLLTGLMTIVAFWPSAIDAGADCVTLPSARGVTPMVSGAAASFEVFESNVVVVAEALFVIEAADVGATTSVIVALLPLAIVPRLHVIGPVPLHVPLLGVTETNVAPLNVSLRTTLDALLGPAFATVMLIVAFCDALIDAGPLCVTLMSATCVTAVICSAAGGPAMYDDFRKPTGPGDGKLVDVKSPVRVPVNVRTL